MLYLCKKDHHTPWLKIGKVSTGPYKLITRNVPVQSVGDKYYMNYTIKVNKALSQGIVNLDYLMEHGISTDPESVIRLQKWVDSSDVERDHVKINKLIKNTVMTKPVLKSEELINLQGQEKTILSGLRIQNRNLYHHIMDKYENIRSSSEYYDIAVDEIDPVAMVFIKDEELHIRDYYLITNVEYSMDGKLYSLTDYNGGHHKLHVPADEEKEALHSYLTVWFPGHYAVRA
jgi:hypothetical protein